MDNRELASVIWLGAVLAAALFHRPTRQAITGVVRAALHVKLVVPVVAMAVWVLGLVRAADAVGLWDAELVVPTTAWFVASGLLLLFNLDRAWKATGFFSGVATNLIGIAVFLGFFMNLFTLSLLGELLMQPLAAFLFLLALVAHRDPAHQLVARTADGLTAALGLTLAAFTITQLVRDWDVLDLRLLGLELVLPIWLTLGVLPFICVVALYASYELAFVHVNHALPAGRDRRRVKAAAILTFRHHIRDVSRLPFFWVRQAGESGSASGARSVLGEFRATKRLEEQQAEQALLRRVTSAGLVGIDESGRQLDQREFAETRRALQWLSTRQMGWYRNHGNRYHGDMLDIAGDFSRQGLPTDHGIELHVAEDGQSWWAGRRTITGWCFAVGAADPPPDQWEYDGSQLPRGFPCVHPDWGDRPFSLDACANW